METGTAEDAHADIDLRSIGREIGTRRMRSLRSAVRAVFSLASLVVGTDALAQGGPCLTSCDDDGWSPPAVANGPKLYDLLGSTRPDRWLVAWRTTLANMDAGSLRSVVNDPRIAAQAEAKELRLQIVLGCNVSMGKAELEGRTEDDLVADWCSAFSALGGSLYLNEAGRALADDEGLQAAPFRVLWTRKLDGTPAEKAAEQSFLESTFRNASEPWSIERSIRALWNYRSPLLTDEWNDVEKLSKFQQSRLRHAAAIMVTCRETRDCDAASVWTVEFCSTTPGAACPRGAGFDEVMRQNLSPHELALLQKIMSYIQRSRRS